MAASGLIAIAIAFYMGADQKSPRPIPFRCSDRPAASTLQLTIPETHYLYSDTYGWFDTTHFDTGQPARLLADVTQAVTAGGGLVTIRQGVRDDITGYSAVYRVSGRLRPADIEAAALGIYLDWSVRFEEWQGQPPRVWVGPLTPFAVEDLPSQYLGFYMRAHQVSLAEIFGCYLGSVTVPEDEPPDFVLATETAVTTLPGIRRLENTQFTPLIETSAGWQRVSWPRPLQMTPILSTPDTWQFLVEDTWYLGEDQQPTPPVMSWYSQAFQLID